MKEAIEQEIDFLREHIKALRRFANGIENQIDRMETRIDDLRRAIQPPPVSPPAG